MMYPINKARELVLFVHGEPLRGQSPVSAICGAGGGVVYLELEYRVVLELSAVAQM